MSEHPAVGSGDLVASQGAARVDVGDEITFDVPIDLRGGREGDAVFVFTGWLRSTKAGASTDPSVVDAGPQRVRGCELARFVDGQLVRRRVIMIGLGDMRWDEPSGLGIGPPVVIAAGEFCQVRWFDVVEGGWESWLFTLDADGTQREVVPFTMYGTRGIDTDTVLLDLTGARVRSYADIPADLRIAIGRERPEFAFAPGPGPIRDAPAPWRRWWRRCVGRRA